MRAAAFLCLLAAGAAARAFGAEAGGHGGGIPWGEIVKQAINFAILAAVLGYFLRKPLSNYLRERSESLRKAIDEAARAREEAAGRLSAVEERVAGLSAEIEEMNRRADADARAETARIAEAARAEIERIRQQARFTADQEVKKAREELRREAAELAARAAGEIVAREITPEDQERLVRENIEKIRGMVR